MNKYLAIKLWRVDKKLSMSEYEKILPIVCYCFEKLSLKIKLWNIYIYIPYSVLFYVIEYGNHYLVYVSPISES